MEFINRRIQATTSRAETKIVALGCVHHGAAGCDEKLAAFWYNRILNSPDTYCILGGDLVDSISEKDKRYDEGEVARWCFDRQYGGTLIDRQFNYALDKWWPLAKAGKILWIHAGNHEWKLRSTASRDLTLDWARRLRVPYAGLSALSNLFIETKGGTKRGGSSIRVTFYTTHGSGGAQTNGAVMNKVASMLDQYDVDVALMWHLHKRMHIARRAIGITQPDKKQTSDRKIRDRLAAVCGTFLDGHIKDTTGYGELKGYSPIVPGPPVVHIKMDYGPPDDNGKRGNFTRIWISDAIIEKI